MPSSPELAPSASDTTATEPASQHPPKAVDTSPPRSSSSSASPKKGKTHKRSSSSVTIADSPLKQVNTDPSQNFKLKVVSVYDQLFKGERHPPGYWVELFLLPVNKAELTRVIRAAQPLTRHEATVQVLFRAAIANLGPQLPDDIIINALNVLEVVFSEALDLAVKTPTTQIIQLLAGIDRASKLFNELTSDLLALLQQKSLGVVAEATRFILTVARRTLGTPLNTLFSTKNFFAALIDVIDKHVDHRVASDAFTLIGVLTALNIYDDDGASIYQQRMSDYVDEVMMAKIIALVQRELSSTGSSKGAAGTGNSSGISSWFSSWFSSPSEEPSSGNGVAANGAATNRGGGVAQITEHDGWQVLLSLYLFVENNPIFTQSFASSPALITLIQHSVRVLQNMQASSVEHSRAWLIVLLLRKLTDVEFLTLIDPAVSTIIRIEAAKLALDTSRRVPLAGILDLVQVGLRIEGKSKTSSDFEILEQLTNILYQICLQTVKTRSIWTYDWPQLWRTVLSLIKHLSMKKDPKSELVIHKLANVVVGMSLHRDILDEEDWAFLMFRIVQNSKLFNTVTQAFPSLEDAPAIRASKAMIGQYELNTESPDFAVIVRQGKLALGNATLIGESLRSFSARHEPLLKRIVKLQIKNTDV